EAQQKLELAQEEAQRIKQTAELNAQTAKDAILAQSAVDIQRMQEAGAADLNSELERVITQLRQKVVLQALQKVEGELKAGISDNAQQALIARSIAQLGGEI
ncbi:MAG: F0F1 ATP synthase subunit B, partial [Dolichospermum sp.]